MRRRVVIEVEWDDVAHEAIAAKRVGDRLVEMIADCMDLMESRGSVSDPSVYGNIATYADQFRCGVCGEAALFTEDDESRSGRCSCGAFVWYESKTKGALDLGIIREDPPGENQLHIFEESFQSVIDKEES